MCSSKCKFVTEEYDDATQETKIFNLCDRRVYLADRPGLDVVRGCQHLGQLRSRYAN